jgi:hypothetical protein
MEVSGQLDAPAVIPLDKEPPDADLCIGLGLGAG